MSEHDIIVAGGGHNGLTAAAYLAKAGFDVIVLEAREYVGGGVVTSELTEPGFRHDMYATAHVLILDNPMISQDELGLASSHGLRYVYPDPGFAVVFPGDDRYIAFYRDVHRTAATIATISPADAESYLRFHAFADRMHDVLMDGMFAPPLSLGRWISRLDRSETGREVIRMCMMSYLDVIEEWFGDPVVRAALTRWVSESMAAPETGCTGAILLTMLPSIHRRGVGFPVGGSGSLSEALVRAITALGGTVRTGAPVARFEFAGDRVTGVVLASGERITARRAVLADLNIRQIPDLAGGRFGDSWARKTERIKPASFAALAAHAALREAPRFRAGPEVSRAGIVEVALPLPRLRRAFDDLKYGIAAPQIPTVAVPTVWDPTRAPAGRHTLYLLSYAPVKLADGAWGDRRGEVFDHAFAAFANLTTNMDSGQVISHVVASPEDMGRANAAWPGGDGEHFGAQFFQLMGWRPLPGMDYRLPAEGLYLVGPSTHPGAGVTGGARAAAQAVLADLSAGTSVPARAG